MTADVDHLYVKRIYLVHLVDFSYIVIKDMTLSWVLYTFGS
jgi:hypothetical protein